MLQFIVLGLVPGTNYQISFNLLLLVLLTAGLLIATYHFGRRRLPAYLAKFQHINVLNRASTPTE